MARLRSRIDALTASLAPPPPRPDLDALRRSVLAKIHAAAAGELAPPDPDADLDGRRAELRRRVERLATR